MPVSKLIKTNYKTLIAALWLLFTISLVTWWWKLGLSIDGPHREMIFWEGIFLIAVILAGGISLVFLTYKDEENQKRIRLFFANFSHDLKTSISRLRLQSEVLLEENENNQNPLLRRLLNDIAKLDLQLENSLWISNIDELRLFSEKVKLSSILDNMRNEFHDISLELSQDIVLFADRRALASIIKNLIHNSIVHSHATHMTIETNPKENEFTLKSNGINFDGNTDNLGKNSLSSGKMNSTGMGLYLCRELLKRMSGNIQFSAHSGPLECKITLPGVKS